MRRSSFLRDQNAFTGWDFLQILLLLVIPVGLFIFWFQYLRRIGKDEAAKAGPWTGMPRPGGAAQSASTGDAKRTCARCGLTVRPSRSSGPPTCPNCMSTL
jgi:hypothetical protein